MKKNSRHIILLLTVCVMIITLIPVTAGAKTYKHRFSYDLRGGTPSIASFTVKDKKTFTISTKVPKKPGYKKFDGYYAYRVSDKKYYVSGKGWKKSSKGAKLYKPGQTLKLDSSWTKGKKKSNYKLIAHYSQRYHVVEIRVDAYSDLDAQWVLYVVNNGNIRLPARLKNQGAKLFQGWVLYRIADGKYYVAGHGWYNNSVIEKNDWSKKVYKANSTVKLNGSWTKGCKSWSNYSFVPYWSYPTVDVRVPSLDGEKSNWLW